MPTVTNEHVTALPIRDQRALLSMPQTTTTLLRIPRRRPFTLLHVLQTVKVAWIALHRRTGPRINPDYPRQETVPERAARIDLSLRPLPLWLTVRELAMDSPPSCSVSDDPPRLRGRPVCGGG